MFTGPENKENSNWVLDAITTKKIYKENLSWKQTLPVPSSSNKFCETKLYCNTTSICEDNENNFTPSHLVRAKGKINE